MCSERESGDHGAAAQTAAIVYVQVPAYGFDFQVEFRIRPSTKGRVFENIEELLRSFTRGLGDEAEPVDLEASAQKRTEMYKRVAQGMEEYRSSVRMVESWKQKVERATSELNKQREAYLKEVTNLREQLYAKSRCDKEGRDFVPSATFLFPSGQSKAVLPSEGCDQAHSDAKVQKLIEAHEAEMREAAASHSARLARANEQLEAARIQLARQAALLHKRRAPVAEEDDASSSPQDAGSQAERSNIETPMPSTAFVECVAQEGGGCEVPGPDPGAEGPTSSGIQGSEVAAVTDAMPALPPLRRQPCWARPRTKGTHAETQTELGGALLDQMESYYLNSTAECSWQRLLTDIDETHATPQRPFAADREAKKPAAPAHECAGLAQVKEDPEPKLPVARLGVPSRVATAPLAVVRGGTAVEECGGKTPCELRRSLAEPSTKRLLRRASHELPSVSSPVSSPSGVSQPSPTHRPMRRRSHEGLMVVKCETERTERTGAFLVQDAARADGGDVLVYRRAMRTRGPRPLCEVQTPSAQRTLVLPVVGLRPLTVTPRDDGLPDLQAKPTSSAAEQPEPQMPDAASTAPPTPEAAAEKQAKGRHSSGSSSPSGPSDGPIDGDAFAGLALHAERAKTIAAPSIRFVRGTPCRSRLVCSPGAAGASAGPAAQHEPVPAESAPPNAVKVAELKSGAFAL